MKKTIIIALAALLSLPTMAQKNSSSITIDPAAGKQTISRHIYGQFSEHLGACIYGGLWVGKNSSIPNIDGYRTDMLQALKNLQIPNLRWPGGCFADEYHWMDGIGPQENRPKMVNNNWGGTVEDNSFGTHEFLNLCEMLGCEPYISGNIGSGSVEELAKWIEYMTNDGDSPMANLRRQNGRDKAWKVKFLGIGNESWGCGGTMEAPYYANVYRRYQTYCRNFSGNHLFKVACGASDYDLDWTEVLMQKAKETMNGLSLHYYSVESWVGSKGSATKFTDDEYYRLLAKCKGIEPVIQRHIAIMDKYDPEKKVKLMVDEWGTWFDVEPGTNPGHLFQQNTMRDAMVAALSLNVFHKYDRIGMTNIAQIANVLQAMILTKDDKLVLTPTYHVFEMYKVHQEATYLPIEIETPELKEFTIREDNIKLSNIDATASKDKNGKIHISLANISLDKDQTISINLKNMIVKGVEGTILTSANIRDHNTFENPNVVKPVKYTEAKIKHGKLTCNVPAKSIITLEIK